LEERLGMNGAKEKISKLLATCFYCGYLPKAPGTWGSLLSAIVCYFLVPTQGFFPLVFVPVVFVIGSYSAQVMEKESGIHDDPRIVIDEFLGFYVSVFYLPPKLSVFIVSFIAFRLFDILKPGPVRRIDRSVKGGVGVMLDDLVAGFFANIIARILSLTVL
jgi:phosphatidylglycerophosphatase A